jgi:hypothetical protein
LAQDLGFPSQRVDEFWYQAERRLRLAGALDVSVDAVGDAGYLTRMEFGLAPTADSLMAKASSDRPKRTLSLVANDLDGDMVFTIKGADVFNASADGNTSEYVKNARSALDEAATRRIPPDREDLWAYPYGDNTDRNLGTLQRFREDLIRLALVGWELYNQVVPKNAHERNKLRRELDGDGLIIQVAHVLLGKAVPWAVFYEHKFTINKQRTPEGLPMTTDACLACLPGPGGKLKGSHCGELPNCLLHPAQLTLRHEAGLPAVDSETVACPRHFWGFRHLIELPPQQTRPDLGENGVAGVVQPQPERIENSSPTLMAAGSHLDLRLWDDHWLELKQLEADLNHGVLWRSLSHHRDRILADLAATDLDVVYLYCHARDGDTPKATTYRPQLEFCDRVDPPGTITADDLALSAGQQPWSHHPLVFLNGCGTTGLSTKAMSEFIKQLVWEREAAGVIGTEVPIPEQLATAIGLHFLNAFLAGHSAGEALLTARRWLLSIRNPLGLIYTLYAPADLALAKPARLANHPISTGTIAEEENVVIVNGVRLSKKALAASDS